MARTEDIRTLHKMNKDTEDRYLQPHEVRSKMNLRSGGSETDNTGAIEKIKGNVERTYSAYTGTDKTVIGSCVNHNDQSVIFFVHSTDGYHHIVRYNRDSDTSELIIDYVTTPITVDPTILNFNTDHPIQARVLDDFLIWTDNYNPPRIINIPRMRNTVTNTGTDQYEIFNEDVITYGATPPLTKPTVAYGSDTDYKQNNLRTSLFQFCYRWTYKDGSKSVTSPLSDVAYPQDEETGAGSFILDYTVNNYISVVCDIDNPEVKDIEIFVKENKNGFWKLFDRKENTSSTTITVDFYNTKVGETVDQNEINRIYYDIPQKAKALETIDKGRMSFGNFVSGYDNVDIDTELSVAYTERNYAGIIYMLIDNTPSNSACLLEYDLGIPTPIEIGKTYRLRLWQVTDYDIQPNCNLSDQYSVKPLIFSYTTVSGDTSDEIGNYFVAEITGMFSDSDNTPATWDSGTSTLSIRKSIYNNLDIQKYLMDPNIAIFTDTTTTKFNNWKSGRWKSFGIVYKDSLGRAGAVNTQQEVKLSDTSYAGTRIFLPKITDRGLTVNDFKRHSSQIGFKIKNRPPAWAKKWQWVVNEREEWYIELPVSNIYDKPGTSSVLIDISSDFMSEKERNKSFNPGIYSFEKGDRLRLIKENGGDYATTFETEIKGVSYSAFIVDDNGNYVLKDGEKIPNTSTLRVEVESFDYSDLNIGAGSVVEIYRPLLRLENDNKIFRAIGDSYDVLNPGTGNQSHAADVINQSSDLTQDAIGVIQGNNSFVRPFLVGTQLVIVEANEFSDYYDSDYKGWGKSFVINSSMKQARDETGIKVGNQYFKGSDINGLQEIDFGAKYLDSKHGPIQRMDEIGYTLKVKQLHKNTSIYIGRQEIHNADGSTQLMTSKDILGTIRPPIEMYGTPFPESVCVNNRHSYFYDPYTASIIRDSANGMIDIAEAYNIKDYIRTKSKAILNAGLENIRVVSVFDAEYNELVISFIHLNDITSSINDTIVFHEPTNCWTYHASYIPEHMESIGTVFVSFKDGKLWRHNVNTTYNSFYGTVYPSSVEFVSNKGFQYDREFKVLKIDGMGDWYSNYGDIKVPVSEQYPRGMESRLLAGEFKQMNSEQVAVFNKNSKTNQTSHSLYDLLNGESLRGKILHVILRNDSENYQSINSVNVESQIMK